MSRALGGPGGGTDPEDRSFFNPQKYRIVLLDQRGSGKSTPYVTTRYAPSWRSKPNRIGPPRTACIEENTTWDLVKYDLLYNIYDEVWLVKPPTPGTSKRYENTLESKSGMFLEAPGCAGAEGWITRFFDLTLFQGFHTLLGLRTGMDPRLPDYVRVIELFQVSS
jgi:hypothetical protein